MLPQSYIPKPIPPVRTPALAVLPEEEGPVIPSPHPPLEPPQPATASPQAPSDDDIVIETVDPADELAGKSLRELKALCAQHQLPTHGKKSDLAERLTPLFKPRAEP